MKTLIGFELRKIFSRHLTVLALAVVMGFSALVTVTTLRGMHSFDGVSQEGSGRKAVAIDRAVAEQYAGPLSDEKVRQILQKFHPQYDLHGMNAKYLQINATQSAVFARFADQDGNWNGLSVSDVFGQEEIQVGYVEGWLCTSRNLAQVLFLLALAVILMTAPVFSGEYAGVDNLILTSRFGRTRGAAAKLAASFLAAGTVTGLCCLLVLLPALLFYRKEGLSCSVLFAPAIYLEAWIPFNLSCGTVLEYQVLLGFTAMFSVTGLTLLLSSLCKNQMAAATGAAVLFFLPMLLPVQETSPLFRLLVLLPVYHVQYISLLSVEQLGQGVLYALWAVPAAAVPAIGGAGLSKHFFSRHQVL